MGSVICRSMENSVGEHIRKQLREARGIGGLICRIDVTTGLWSDVSGGNVRAFFLVALAVIRLRPPANIFYRRNARLARDGSFERRMSALHDKVARPG